MNIRYFLLCVTVYCFGLIVPEGWAATGPIPVMAPRPQHIEVGNGRVELPAQPTIAISPQATDIEKYAALMLKKDMEERFGIKAEISTKAKGAAVVIGVPATNESLGAAMSQDLREALALIPRRKGGATEGYVMATVGSGTEVSVIVAGTDPNGAMYGAFTLQLLFEKHGARLTLPAQTFVKDWPVMHDRGKITGLLPDATPAYVNHLDVMARWRLNAGYFQQFYPYSPPKGGWKKTVPPELKVVIGESHKRGIETYGGLTWQWTTKYLKRNISTKRPADVALVRGLFEDMAKAGCDGLYFLFDDIKKADGQDHAKWCVIMKEAADLHGGRKLLMCPTHYRQHQATPYHRAFRKYPELNDMDTYYCAFRAKNVEKAKRAGLRNYVWWHNNCNWGGWGGKKVKIAGKPDYGVLQRVEAGWYGGPSAVPALKNLHNLTRLAWLLGGMMEMWGDYVWNPARYDPEDSERRLSEVLLGGDVGAAYMTILKHSREQMARIRKGQLDPKIFAESDTKAKKALADMRKLIVQTRRPGLWPLEKRKETLETLEGNLAMVRSKAVPQTSK